MNGQDPYIGITGFTSREQVERILKVFRTHRRAGSRRKLHVGVMMSYGTLNNRKTIYQDVFPQKGLIYNIFGSDETYNCLHYADYKFRTEREDFYNAIMYGGMGMNSFQLDMVWPSPIDLSNAIHDTRKHIEVILQIGKGAMEEVSNNPLLLVERLRAYDGVIHRILLDRSMGQGRPMNAEFLRPFAAEIKRVFPNLGIGFAGGLGPKSVNLVKPLLDEFPELSMDAESQLRLSGSNLDPIDMDTTEEYIIEALRLVG